MSVAQGSTPYCGLYGEATHKWGTFFRLQVYEMLGTLFVEVYKRVGKSVISVCKRTKRGKNAFYGCKRDKKTSWFSDLFIKKDGAFTAVLTLHPF